MPLDHMANEVLQLYDLGPIAKTIPLGNAGGFSGATLWRVQAQEGQFCLRLWPSGGYNPDYAWLHEILRRGFEAGLPLATPILNRNGQSLVSLRGRSFELSPWMPGTADFNDDPSESRVRSLIECVARFHQTFRDSFRYAPSKAITMRCAKLRSAPEVISKLNDGPLLRPPVKPIDHLARRLLTVLPERVNRLEPQLARFLSVELQTGPVIRDLHHDHVLFTGDSITGIVDFGSMSIDSRCLDLARLVGSLEMENVPPWDLALDRYSQAVTEFRTGSELSNPLSPAEIELIELLHQCNVVVGALNWLDWILLQNRQFENEVGIEKRLEFFAKSLRV